MLFVHCNDIEYSFCGHVHECRDACSMLCCLLTFTFVSLMVASVHIISNKSLTIKTYVRKESIWGHLGEDRHDQLAGLTTSQPT